MVPEPVRLFHPKGPDRVAVVSAEPSSSGAGAFLVRVGRGPSMTRLTGGASYGPYDEDDLAAPFTEAVENLRNEGFLPSGLHALLSMLREPNGYTRARAAQRVGWRRDVEAVDHLLAVLPQAVDDTCAILDALGAIGDERAVPVLREYAARKLLSRRRSGVEALRNIGDEEGLEEARQRALERLPADLRALLDTLGEDDDASASVDRLVAAVQSLLGSDAVQGGLALDTLQELATPLPVAAVRKLVATVRYDQAHVWRYVKSVFKRAMLRHDYVTFGIISHAIEAQGRQTTGTTALVKSGYDGVQRQTTIFRQKTQLYLRRLSWRYLRRLARHRPAAYPYAAAEAIIHYSPSDAEPEQDLYGPYASCYLLYRVAFGASKRFRLDSRRLKVRYASARSMQATPKGREESYPELWDVEPRAYLRVLGAARLAEAHVFAHRQLSSERLKVAVLAVASHEEVLAMLQAPYDPTVELGLEELDRRFDPERPDWALVALVLADERPMVREVAQRWVRLTAPRWTRDAEQVLSFLTVAHPELRTLVIDLARAALPQLPEVRQQLALRALVVLRKPEPTPGAHEAIGQLARLSLLAELDAVLSLEEVVSLIMTGSLSAQAVGGDLLGRRPAAVGDLGLERLVSLAGHEVAAVRAASHLLLRAALDQLRQDPSPLFVLVENDWPDTRNLAFDLLRNEIHPEKLGLEGITGLIDSNREDVQQVGCELVEKFLTSLPVEVLIYRLVEHPHPALRRFTIGMIVAYLPDSPEALERVQRFIRAAMFDLWPDRVVKHRVVEFLGQRGLKDESQARVAADLLSELVRLQGQADFERALEALVRLKLAYPDLDTPIHLRAEGLA
jgi:HEAT repeats